MLKISGEALAGEQGFGIDADLVLHFAKEVAAMALEGVQARARAAARARARGAAEQRARGGLHRGRFFGDGREAPPRGAPRRARARRHGPPGRGRPRARARATVAAAAAAAAAASPLSRRQR
jgi:hypothetical protein